MGVTIKDTDHGFKRRTQLIRSIGRPRLTIGVHAAEGSEPKEGGKDTTVLEVAIWQEFGTSRIPSRSYLRSWFDEHNERAHKILAILMRKVAREEMSEQQAYDTLGLMIVGEIQDRISQGIPPPLADSTIRRKGSSVPLIDTGQLRSSITHKVQ